MSEKTYRKVQCLSRWDIYHLGSCPHEADFLLGRLCLAKRQKVQVTKYATLEIQQCLQKPGCQRLLLIKILHGIARLDMLHIVVNAEVSPR